MKLIIFIHHKFESLQTVVCDMIPNNKIAKTWNGVFVYSEEFAEGLHKIGRLCDEQDLPMFATNDQYMWLYNNPQEVGISFDENNIYIKQSGTHENIIRLRTQWNSS